MIKKLKPILFTIGVLVFAASMAYAYSFGSLLKGDKIGARGIFTTVLTMSDGYQAHSFANGTTAWTLSDEQNYSTVLSVTLAGGAANIIAKPTEGKIFWLYNGSGAAITLKGAMSTGIAVANARAACLVGTGTDFVRLTADQVY